MFPSEDDVNVDQLLSEVDTELEALELPFGTTPKPGTAPASPAPSNSTSQNPEQPAEPTPVTAPQGQSNTVEIDGQKYSVAEIKAWKENVATAEQLNEWQAKLSKEQQSLKSKGRDIRKEISDLKAEAYDEDKQKMLDLLEQQAEQLESQQKFMDSLNDEREFNEAKTFVAQARADLESRYSDKLPELDSKEFRDIVKLSQEGNKLEMAYLLWKNGRKPAVEPKLPALDSKPSTEDPENFDEGLAREAQRAGIPYGELKAAMEFGKDKEGFL